MCSEANLLSKAAVAKASLNRALQLHAVDPKPGDLPMARMKREQSHVEVRTGER